jgi:hypothetical protein
MPAAFTTDIRFDPFQISNQLDAQSSRVGAVTKRHHFAKIQKETFWIYRNKVRASCTAKIQKFPVEMQSYLISAAAGYRNRDSSPYFQITLIPHPAGSVCLFLAVKIILFGTAELHWWFRA